MPLVIQVFTADQTETLFTIPLPRLLSEYQTRLIDDTPRMMAEQRNDPNVGWEQEDIDRDNAVNNAVLLAAVERWQRTGQDENSVINASIMARVFSDPLIRKNFRMMACNHIIQYSLPPSPDGDASVQWVRLEEGERKENLYASFDQDRDLMVQFMAQIDENLAWLTELTNKRRS